MNQPSSHTGRNTLLVVLLTLVIYLAAVPWITSGIYANCYGAKALAKPLQPILLPWYHLSKVPGLHEPMCAYHSLTHETMGLGGVVMVGASDGTILVGEWWRHPSRLLIRITLFLVHTHEGMNTRSVGNHALPVLMAMAIYLLSIPWLTVASYEFNIGTMWKAIRYVALPWYYLSEVPVIHDAMLSYQSLALKAFGYQDQLTRMEVRHGRIVMESRWQILMPPF